MIKLPRMFPLPHILSAAIAMVLSPTPQSTWLKPEGKQHVILEAPMEEPAWKRLKHSRPSQAPVCLRAGAGDGAGGVEAGKAVEQFGRWSMCLKPSLQDALAGELYV
ncbi:MAG: hypothetical protein ACFB0C_23070 [Leptolyngbyaceae cyanobacterium]